MSGYKITAKRYVTMPDGTAIPLSDISQEDKESHFNSLINNVSLELSFYYTQNPDAYVEFCNNHNK